MANGNLMSVAPTDRVGRYPKHTFYITGRPYVLEPMMIAPVLPGETLQNMYMESRVVTDPIKSPLIGWKQEYFFFYVRISDLLRDVIKNMFIDPTNADLAGSQGIAADDADYFTAKGGIPYAKWCTERVTMHYFRDTGEAWNAANSMLGTKPLTQIKDLYWMDSLTDESKMPEGSNISAATTAGDLDRLMDAFEHLRAMGMANMSYEDFLRTYGISVKDPTEGKPEMLWHLSDFQYPSNTVNPANGAPSSAVSWVFKQSSREKKFFTEPGFIVGYSVTRPKVYLGGQRGNASAHLSRAWDWMPALLLDTPETRLKSFLGGTGPLGDRSGTGSGVESQYWIDMNDIFMHGDQWIGGVNANADLTIPADGQKQHVMPLPTWFTNEDTWDFKYLWDVPIDSMFVSATPANKVRQDGMVSLSIKGKQIDTTAAASFVA